MTESASLDRDVAERVMGWQHPKGRFVADGPGQVVMLIKKYMSMSKPWSPSTDIAAAWDVVERMRKDRMFILRNTTLGRWSAEFSSSLEVVEYIADTPCTAICRAALAAVGEKGTS